MGFITLKIGIHITYETEESEILVVKERRKSRDSADGRTSRNIRTSSDSSESNSANADAPTSSDSDLQERLSLNTFLRSVPYKDERTTFLIS